jgi:hypothetical protein
MLQIVMMRRNPATTVDVEFINELKAAACLIAGTISIALPAGWALKRFGTPKKMKEPPIIFIIPTCRLRDVAETIKKYGEHFWRNGQSPSFLS